ncbi:MAG TPA: hypothetical protein VFN74_14170 [Chloroflexota bacterium]|nr:hypothetical protein [Chloroflexota bacterium]
MTDGATVIREAPRARRAGGLSAVGFVPVVPRTPDFVQRMGRYSGGFDFTLPALILAGALYGLLTGLSLLLLLRRATPRRSRPNRR